MDGIEATHEIHKQVVEGKRPFIIAVTANALEGEQERLLAEGLDDYISKPIRLNELKNALENALSHIVNNKQ